MPPMVVGMAGKVMCTIFESELLRRRVPRLAVRKVSNSIATLMVSASTVAFAFARSPLTACVLYCVASLGHCFDYPGFVANYIEQQGPDVGVMGAYSNTVRRNPKLFSRFNFRLRGSK